MPNANDERIGVLGDSVAEVSKEDPTERHNHEGGEALIGILDAAVVREEAEVVCAQKFTNVPPPSVVADPKLVTGTKDSSTAEEVEKPQQ